MALARDQERSPELEAVHDALGASTARLLGLCLAHLPADRDRLVAWCVGSVPGRVTRADEGQRLAILERLDAVSAEVEATDDPERMWVEVRDALEALLDGPVVKGTLFSEGGELRLPVASRSGVHGVFVAEPGRIERERIAAAATLCLRLGARLELARSHAGQRSAASFASHEVRNSLTAIVFATELLRRKTSADDGVQRRLVMISSAAAEANLRLDWLSLAAALETGSLGPAPHPAPLDRLVQAAIDACRPVALQRRIELQHEAPSVERVVDAGHAQSALAAATWVWVSRASAGSSVTLTAEPGHGALRFVLEGTSLEPLPRSAQAGPSLWPDTKAEGVSPGLAMAVSRGVVEALGGTSRLSDDERRFEITLPG